MLAKFKKHLDKVFLFCPKTQKVLDFKEELLGVLMDRFSELTASGMSDEDAYGECIKSIDDYSETIRVLEKDKPAEMTRSQFSLIFTAPLAYLFATLIVYFTASFASGKWGVTWITFILALVVYLIGIFVGVYVIAKRKSSYFVIRSVILILFGLVTTLIYLGISFSTEKWAFTWIIYLIGAFVWYITDIFFRIRHKVSVLRIFDGLTVTFLLTLATYFAASFISGRWDVTWILFLVGILVMLVIVFIGKWIKYRNNVEKK